MKYFASVFRKVSQKPGLESVCSEPIECRKALSYFERR
jgi:hypothetical protein